MSNNHTPTEAERLAEEKYPRIIESISKDLNLSNRNAFIAGYEAKQAIDEDTLKFKNALMKIWHKAYHEEWTTEKIYEFIDETLGRKSN